MMVATHLKTEIKDRAQLPLRAPITIERRKVAGKQLRFNWDEKESSAPQPSTPTPSPTKSTAGKASTPTQESPATASHSSRKPAAGPIKSRVGETTKLGVVMLRLLKRYGITDEEIIEGLSTSTAS